MTDKFIYNQNKIPKDKWRYGFRPSAKTGCGWIAAYNALLILGQDPNPEKLIKYFEKSFPILNGNAGTFISNPIMLFKKMGYKVTVTAKNSQFDKVVNENRVCILFYYWKRDHKTGSHFVALHKVDDKVYGYNTFSNSQGPDYYGKSLEEFIEKRKYFATVLIGIS